MKIGIVGVGHLGKIHLKCIREIPEFELIGVFDNDLHQVSAAAEKFDVQTYEDLALLISDADVISIVTPTTTHFDIASEVIRAGKHVFIEKPVTQTVTQARALQRLAAEKGVKVQVGHVERFNPALLALKGEISNPAFMEVHRLANYNPRSTDVSVVHDLMIHDIDILLHFFRSPVKEVRANGLSILSRSDDICSARVEFENGAVANLTASRISVKNMRKMRLFQSNAYISIDFLEKKSQIIRIDPEKTTEESMLLDLGEEGHKYISIRNIEGQPGNAIREELEAFYNSVKYNRAVKVPLEDGLRALELVEQIESAIQEQGNVRDFIHSNDIEI